MTPRSHTIRHRLLVAGALGAFALALAAVPSVSHAADGACPSATGPNGKVFGSRFGRLLGAAGVAAITGRKATARAAADAAVRDARDTARENVTAEAAAAACNESRKEPSTPGEADESADAGSAVETAYKRPGLMPISAEIKAKKEAFDEFGKVHCSDCEGGYEYESWANKYFYNEIHEDRNGWANKLAKMEPGDEIHWQGSENYGTITMRSQEQIGGFDCKTYGWVLEKGSSSAHRDGLLCWGKASDFSANDSWVEVY